MTRPIEFLLEEGIVRARLSETFINQLAEEMSLDLEKDESWVELERMSIWFQEDQHPTQ